MIAAHRSPMKTTMEHNLLRSALGQMTQAEELAFTEECLSRVFPCHDWEADLFYKARAYLLTKREWLRGDQAVGQKKTRYQERQEWWRKHGR